jgi:hypothetical protein
VTFKVRKHTRRVSAAAGAAAVLAVIAPSSAMAPPTVSPVAPQTISTSHAQQYAGNIGNGPSTQIGPYVLPTNSGVDIVSLLSVAEPWTRGFAGTAPAGFPTGSGVWSGLAGIPDGMGAWRDTKGNNDPADDEIVLYVNHEIGATNGVARDHGQKGAFVSKLTIDPSTFQVKTGEDLIKSVQHWQYTWDGGAGGYAATPTASFLPAFGRLCAATLFEQDVLFNAGSGNGYNGRIFFTGEENGSNGRGMAVDTATGQAVQVPRLGLMSFENALMAKTGNDTTLVVSNDDSTPTSGGAFQDAAFLRVYSGTKTNSGTFADKAGLTNGSSFALKVGDGTVGTDAAFRTTYGRFNTQAVSFVGVDWNKSGVNQYAEAKAANAMAFWRIEDGSFDPRPGKQNDYYFVTTASQSSTGQKGGLWKLTFTDLNDLSKGGQLTLILDGNQGTGVGDPLTMQDGIEIDSAGHLILQEDPGSGNNFSSPSRNRLAKMYALDLDTLRLVQLAEFDKAKFDNFGGTDPSWLTQDEESSGVIDAAGLIGGGWFLFNAQVHTSNTNASPAASTAAGKIAGSTSYEVENGQIMAMKVNWAQVFDEGPAPVVPEAPLTILLPAGALATMAGAWLVLKRKPSVA